ncbi:hypothetical protein, conserved [Leishmania donovani]|uniref:Uncharacterized protein n=1 Tax=Leishmania donovani TaxID=5661 RepID=A0A3Q8IGN5_LEIDO|nr:hypothetical protein, conserved [Leishmania donovani]AYU83951.1 hypothetical protein LdCL_360066700 [Leishmania donovani]TPP48697.1 hypothetical protein CGC21_15235 [Leishmania donovani]CBZ39029.1 hypothetical protein, conserved [Leishmania donovani]
MSHYNTGIGSNVPSLLDMCSGLTAFLVDFIQVVLGQTQTSFQAAAPEDSDPGVYDPDTRSWSGTDGLRYRVPLFSIPSERHTREKVRNVKILMDNCRHICMSDELPATKEEKRFWASYRFIQYQLFLAPACVVAPPVYVFFKVFHDKLPRFLRGRTMPILTGLAVAEMWAEATYPSHQLLSTALRAKTPMGDAARAEWTRLQPIDIPFYIFSSYQFQQLFNSVPEEYLFGGDLASLCG